MVDNALKVRGGNNTSPNPITLFDVEKGAGEILKMQAGADNVVCEGLANKVRLLGVQGAVPFFATVGKLYNRNGDAITPITWTAHYIDAQGREIQIGTGVVADGNSDDIPTPNPACASFGLLENESVVVRITGGDPSLGQGVLFVPVAIHDAFNAISQRTPITQANTRVVVAQPPPGKSWQMPVSSSYPCGAAALGINFDAGAHAFDCYISDDQGNDVQIASADNVPATTIANIFSDTFGSHMFPYPYRLEVEVDAANPITNLVVATLFAEFDLPKDLG